jgi:hypothetical protein
LAKAGYSDRRHYAHSVGKDAVGVSGLIHYTIIFWIKIRGGRATYTISSLIPKAASA